MTGDIAKIKTIATLAKTYQATFIVDDAHGIGVLGKQGGGISEHYQIPTDDIALLVAPLGKAFACLGAIVAGNKIIIDYLRQFARTYRYTTALPPACIYVISQALDMIKSDFWRRDKLNENIDHFIREAKKNGLALISDAMTPIKAILIGSNAEALKHQDFLKQQNIVVAAIRPPTVAVNKAQIRISLSCQHDKSQITKLVNLLAKIKESKSHEFC